MEANKKYLLKKKAKLFRWLAWGCVIFFVLFLIVLFIIVRSHSNVNWSEPMMTIFVLAGLILPILTGVIFNMYSSFAIQELYTYKKQILIYRARKFASRAINLLLEGKTQEAVNEYLKCKRYPERDLDDYLYGMMIFAFTISTNKKFKDMGKKKIKEILEDFNPNNVDL